jgi:hypothetical protein
MELGLASGHLSSPEYGFMEAQMSAVLRFYKDGPFHHFEPVDESFSALGSLLTDDVQGSTTITLDLLQKVERVRLGITQIEIWGGNGWVGEMQPTGMHIEDRFSDDWVGNYSLDVTKNAVMDYLRYLAPSSEERNAALARWEADAGHEHPAHNDI